MRSFCLLSLVFSTYILFSCCQAQHAHEPLLRRRHPNGLYNSFGAESKRDDNVVFTYFVDGLGACGITNGPNDFIVALNSAEFGDGTHCFQMITITIDGKSAQAQITDECPTCSPGGVDFSQGLFEYFGPLAQGELYGTWSYSNGKTSAPPQSTTSYTSLSSTTTTTTTSSVSSITLSSMSTSTATSTSTAVPTSIPMGPQIIMEANLALVELGTLLGALLQFTG